MSTRKLTFTTFLLLSLSAAGQQRSDSAPPAYPLAGQAAQAPAFLAAPPAVPVLIAQAQTVAAPAASPAQAAPSTMDQVVDRFISREHGLMKMLGTRNPLVETYLQNLTADPQLGPVPKDDRYFLGRLDLSESIDRTDFLKDQSMEKHLLGGFGRMFKMQYQPLGFSWMIFADRNDFDREHYDFQIRAPRVPGRCPLPGVRCDPQEKLG